MNNSLILILKNYIENKEYSKYNELLRQEIISIFVSKIKVYDSTYMYSSMVELLETAEEYLGEKDILNIKHVYDLLKKDYKPEVLSGYLTETYKVIVE